MSMTPYYIGDLAPTFNLTCTNDSGVIDQLNGVNPLTQIVVTFRNLSFTTPVDRVGTGTITITDAAHGKFTYQCTSTDTAVPARFLVIFQVIFANGQKTYDPQQWEVKAI